MNGKELLNAYPKTAELVKDWFVEKMIESFKTTDAPYEFKEQMRQHAVNIDNLASIIDNNPRGLFDVFDTNGIYIDIYLGCDMNDWDVSFGYRIRPFKTMVRVKENIYEPLLCYPNRKEAERIAVEEAFVLLNEQLSV